jgi:hypothetical protein
MVGKRLGMLIGGAICAAAISACGAGEHASYSDNLGPGYVQVGQLYYQVQISRQLNQWSDEDRYYLQGYSASELALPVADEWFGVSMQVYNWTNRPHTPTGDFFITDSLGDRYTPLASGTPNPYTYVPALIPAGGQLPAIDSDAYTGWSQGELLIFKIPYTSLVNRPFTLHIVNSADTAKQSRIELDV